MGFRRSEVRILSPRHRKARRDLKFLRAFLRYLKSGWVPYPPHTRLATVGGYGDPSPVGLSWNVLSGGPDDVPTFPATTALVPRAERLLVHPDRRQTPLPRPRPRP